MANEPLPEAPMPDIDRDIGNIVRQRPVRPTVPMRKPDEPSPPSIARDFKNLDDAVGDLPLRFIRAARTLADTLDCRERWDVVEETHAALRAHEGNLR
jgi:hypothetical protein